MNKYYITVGTPRNCLEQEITLLSSLISYIWCGKKFLPVLRTYCNSVSSQGCAFLAADGLHGPGAVCNEYLISAAQMIRGILYK